MNWQDLFQNRIFWAMVVTIVATITNYFGIDFNHEGLVNSLLAVGGGIVAIHAVAKNRSKKTKSVGSVPLNTEDPDHPANKESDGA